MRRTDSAALLEAARDQGIHYDERAERGYQAALVDEAAAAVGADPAACRHFRRNRNADLYLLPAGPRTWVLKILTSKPAATLECEHASLTELFGLAGRTGTFRVPEPGPLFAGRSAYVMELVEGRPLSAALLDRGFPHEEADSAAGAAGTALGTIHRAWSIGPRELDTDALIEDLAHLPFEPDRRERAILDRLVETLKGRRVAASRLYLDFDPVNVLLDPPGAPILLDPPERIARDAVHWDLGTWLFGIRRAAWRWPPAAARLARIREDLRRAFLEGYTAAVGGPAPDGILLETGELFRLAQLWRWWMEPLGFRNRVVGLFRAAYAAPLLRTARRDRFAALKRQLRAADPGTD